MSNVKQKNTGILKKAIWVVLPVVIVAAVVIAVFAGQSSSLSDQIAQLESDKAALSRKLDEADMAVRTTQELAENERNTLNEQIAAADARATEAEARIQAAEALAQEADAKVQEAEGRVLAAQAETEQVSAQLTDMTIARDALQTEKAQITDGIKQVQSALGALVPDDTAAQLQQAQEALSALKEERDSLQAELDSVTIASTKIRVTGDENNAVKELNDLAELSETGLPAGPYTVFVTLLNAAGEEITQYCFPYTIAE